MTPEQKNLSKALAYAGILPPWIALAIAQVFPLAEAGFAALVYGAIIVSFVCGMHWTLSMQTPSLPVNLLVTSNAGALAAWAMLVLSIWSMPFAYVGLAAVLALLLGIDRLLLRDGAIEPWFWVVRRNASIGLATGLLLWSILA